MVSLSLYPQFETNLMSNRQVIEFLLQLKSAKAHGKNYIKVKPPLVRHLLHNCLFTHLFASNGYVIKLASNGISGSVLLYFLIQTKSLFLWDK